MKHPNAMEPDELVAEVLRLRAQIERISTVTAYAITMRVADTPAEVERAREQLEAATDELIHGALLDATWYGAILERVGRERRAAEGGQA